MGSSAFPGFDSPSASTEVPLEMLAACHGRIDKQCETLCRLLAHLHACGSDQSAQEAAVAVVRYFDLAAPHHHADEEEDLFPALAAAVAHLPIEAAAVSQLTASLVADHRDLEQLWLDLRPLLQAVAAGQAVDMAAAVNGFVAAYKQHMAREDQELLPLASRCLSEVSLTRIGQAMRGRRGIVV